MRPALAEQLDLAPHPEGGWFRETWRSAVTFSPAGYDGPRSAATAIYFLLHPGERSRWHVVRSDELWFWHGGPDSSGSLHLHLGASAAAPSATGPTAAGPSATGPIATGPSATGPSATGPIATGPSAAGTILLGGDPSAGQQPQALIPGGVWQSAEPAGPEPVLVSCVVAPGFDFADFRLA